MKQIPLQGAKDRNRGHIATGPFVAAKKEAGQLCICNLKIYCVLSAYSTLQVV